MNAKGYSFHIALNKLDPKHYYKKYPELKGCWNDAEEMQKLAIKNGFERPTFKYDKDAKFDDFTKTLNAFSDKIVKPGDFFFLTFSGHGSNLKRNIYINDSEKSDQTFCLYDRQILDDIIYEHLCRFKEGVRILILNDSCQNRTLAKLIDDEDVPSNYDPTNKYNIFKKEAIKTLDAETAYETQKNNASIYDEMLKNGEFNGVLKASVIQLSACRDNESTMDGFPNSLFTQVLLDILEKKFDGNYDDLCERINEKLKKSSVKTHPSLFFPGKKDDDFVGKKFLTI